jgi:hypothetical protein|tara:strand:- start:2320 stop:2556 length:237 start_codon:yes stop_codon:yes gene_type:complete
LRNVKKLTPDIIKQIIAEEKENVKEFLTKKMLKENTKLLNQLRLLKKVNSITPKSLKEEKDLNTLKLKLIKNIKKGKK